MTSPGPWPAVLSPSQDNCRGVTDTRRSDMRLSRECQLDCQRQRRRARHRHLTPRHGKPQPSAAWIAQLCCPGRRQDAPPVRSRGLPGECTSVHTIVAWSVAPRPHSRRVATDWKGKTKEKGNRRSNSQRRQLRHLPEGSFWPEGGLKRKSANGSAPRPGGRDRSLYHQIRTAP